MRFLFALLFLCAQSVLAHPVDDHDLTKPLDLKLIKKLELDELRFLRNSIYARHGRAFEAASLATFFAARDWYTRNADYSDNLLTPVEKANVDVIARAEKARGGAWTEARYLEWINSTLSELIPDGTVSVEQGRNGKWENTLTCGVPSATASISSSPNGISLVEEALEGLGGMITFVVLLRDGPKSWVGISADDPKTEIPIYREGAHVIVRNTHYADPSTVRARETISEKDCRRTGH